MPTYRQNDPKTFSLLPEGVHRCQIGHAKLKESKSGNEMIAMEVDVMDDRGNTHTLYENLVFTEKAYWKIDQVLCAIGFRIRPGEDVTIEPGDLVGRRGKILVRHVPGTKNPNALFPEIEEWIQPGDAAALSQPDEDDEEEVF